ncbi:MAG: hypothetical protein MRERV_67c002 [Mycoplasmataceae bacterium RV_VA103A]|nr:MAG: hypothetical protein MRERV_67c002 [Mycoplasmataceae bacterium RV_VA103A]
MAPTVAAAGVNVNDKPNVYGERRTIKPAPAAAPPAAPVPTPLTVPIIFPLLLFSTKSLWGHISVSCSIVIAPPLSFFSNACLATKKLSFESNFNFWFNSLTISSVIISSSRSKAYRSQSGLLKPSVEPQYFFGWPNSTKSLFSAILTLSKYGWTFWILVSNSCFCFWISDFWLSSIFSAFNFSSHFSISPFIVFTYFSRKIPNSFISLSNFGIFL